MNKKKIEYLVDSSILVDHLTHDSDGKSLLEKAMGSGICFTTVINSAEVYFSLRNNEEKSAIDLLMRSIKVIGFNSRYSLLVDQFIGKVSSVRDALFCVTAKINKLTIITTEIDRYSKSGLDVKNPINL